MTSVSMNASLPLSICAATNLKYDVAQPKVAVVPRINGEHISSVVSQLATYSIVYMATDVACDFSTEKELTIENSNNCFQLIPNCLKETEKMRAVYNEERQQETVLDNFQPYFHAQQLASKKFSETCAFSTNSEISPEAFNKCLESLTSYINQAKRTSVAEEEMINDKKTLNDMQGLGVVIKAYQNIYRILLAKRVN